LAEGLVMSAYEDDMRLYFARVSRSIAAKQKPSNVASPDYREGFEDGRRYALMLIQRFAQDGITVKDIRILLDTLLKD
jgi:hypothetical protein